MLASTIERGNILNNPFAIQQLQDDLAINFPMIDGQIRATIKQVADFYEVDERTVKRYLDEFSEELKQNGYEVFTGDRLVEAKNIYLRDTDVTQLFSHTKGLGLFNFRAFLNLGMLLKESDKARELRQIILDVFIDTISQKVLAGETKHINKNDAMFLPAYKDSLYYRKKFCGALSQYIDSGNMKYPIFTDLVYKDLFGENAKEYKTLLKLSNKDNLRHTLYTEIITIISAYENGFSEDLRKHVEAKGKMLTLKEARELFVEFCKSPILHPIKEQARTLMASRDKAFRQIIHEKMEQYIGSLSEDEFDKFLGHDAKAIGDKTEKFINILDANKDVFIRLKDK